MYVTTNVLKEMVICLRNANLQQTLYLKRIVLTTSRIKISSYFFRAFSPFQTFNVGQMQPHLKKRVFLVIVVTRKSQIM